MGRAGIHRPADEAAGQPARPHRDDPQGRAHPSRSGRRRQSDPRPFGRFLLPHRQPDPSGAGRVGAAGPPAGDGDRRARRQGDGRPAPLRHQHPAGRAEHGAGRLQREPRSRRGGQPGGARFAGAAWQGVQRALRAGGRGAPGAHPEGRLRDGAQGLLRSGHPRHRHDLRPDLRRAHPGGRWPAEGAYRRASPGVPRQRRHLRHGPAAAALPVGRLLRGGDAVRCRTQDRRPGARRLRSAHAHRVLGQG